MLNMQGESGMNNYHFENCIPGKLRDQLWQSHQHDPEPEHHTFTKLRYTVLFVPKMDTELIISSMVSGICSTNLDY